MMHRSIHHRAAPKATRRAERRGSAAAPSGAESPLRAASLPDIDWRRYVRSRLEDFAKR
jgi:hypothetical protein